MKGTCGVLKVALAKDIFTAEALSENGYEWFLGVWGWRPTTWRRSARRH